MTGFKLVPVEPTLDMLCEGTDVYGSEDCAETDVLGIYKAMLAAAPEPAGESCRTINIDDIDDIVAWADGVQGALGTECADRVTEMEAAASRAVMTAIASAPDRCPHGVRRPHECKECADTIPASEALDWAEREFAAARQSPGEPVQVETTVKESLMTEQPAPDVTALVEEPISVIYIDGVGAGRSRPEACRDGINYITVADTVYWPLSAEDAQLLRSAECGRGEFTGPGSTSPDVDVLVEALEEIRSRSAMNLAMHPNPFELTAMIGEIHQVATAALDAYRKQGGSND